MLNVKSINFFKNKTESNRVSHHTEKYDMTGLPIRRGAKFNLQVECNRPFDPKTDTFQFELNHDSKSPALKTARPIAIYVKEKLDQNSWGAQVVSSSGNQVTFSLLSPPNAPIGKYVLNVKSKGSTGNFSSYSDPQTRIYILMNPWCPDDAVFMDNEQWRKEYVLNDSGRLFVGSCWSPSSIPWSYGQFLKGVLDAVLYTADKADLSVYERKDPVILARKMSAMVNSLDDNGVLAGNWSGDYSDGTSPLSWVGSAEIILKYQKTGRPVKYGQCWVFGGVLTTTLRALGMPCRTITNLPSAHDTDKNLSIDVFLDKNMVPISGMNMDSIWNFHVWNDVWIQKRSDLPPGYGCWNALDATPQEKSDNVYCCGPASLKAIKEGRIDLVYDSDFLLCEINIDKYYKQQQPDGTFKTINIDPNVAGRLICTKAVGSNAREDIMDQYKYTKGSKEEQAATERAMKSLKRPVPASLSAVPVTVTISTRTDDTTVVGNPVLFNITLCNKSSDQLTVILHIHASIMKYNGTISDPFKKDENKEVILEPLQEMLTEMLIDYDDYGSYLTDDASMMFTVGGKVLETGQLLSLQHIFTLLKPKLQIKPSDVTAVGKESKVEFAFQNTLPIPLTDVMLKITGPGLVPDTDLHVGSVGACSNSVTTHTITPSQAGLRKLIGSVNSNELNGVKGSVDINVVT